MAGEVLLSRDGPVAVITLNNPATLNAFDLPMAKRVAELVETAAADGGVRAVLLRGAGKHFCAGGDLAAISAAPDPSSYVLELARTANRALEALRTMPKPVLAELRGAVAGGGVGVSLAADLRIASDSAKLSLAFLKVGLSPDMGATWALPRMVGRGRAFEMATSHEALPIMEAWRLGLVNRVAKDADLERDAMKWAHELAALPPRAVAEVKALLNAAPSNTFTHHIDQDSAAISRTAGSDDFKEGARAFFEKRPPRFTGK
jgi:2-(1,2-epoxy-1,2-dihydrophenyl)acetyl-CoA isomerase